MWFGSAMRAAYYMALGMYGQYDAVGHNLIRGDDPTLHATLECRMKRQACYTFTKLTFPAELTQQRCVVAGFPKPSCTMQRKFQCVSACISRRGLVTAKKWQEINGGRF